MDKKKNLSLAGVTLIVGFMLAVQFQTVKKPVIRDTRDTLELRADFQKEQELQSQLIREIRSNEEKIAKYETKRQQSKEQALRETLEELKGEAGLTKVKGSGITLTVEPINKELLLGQAVGNISPITLKRLLNELNIYGTRNISIDGQRVINTSVIRDINGETKIDGHALSGYPIEIKAITEDLQSAEKLRNQMQVSKIIGEFFVDNLEVSISEPQVDISIPAYQDTIRVPNMKIVEEEKGGNG